MGNHRSRTILQLTHYWDSDILHGNEINPGPTEGAIIIGLQRSTWKWSFVLCLDLSGCIYYLLIWFCSSKRRSPTREREETLYISCEMQIRASAENYVLGWGHSFSSIICDDNCFSFLTDLWCQIYQLELEILWSIPVQRLEVKKKCRCWFHKFPLAPFPPPTDKTWIAEDFFLTEWMIFARITVI